MCHRKNEGMQEATDNVFESPAHLGLSMNKWEHGKRSNQSEKANVTTGKGVFSQPLCLHEHI